MLEGVAFITPPPKVTYTSTTHEVSRGFMRRPEKVIQREKVGEEPITVLNPITGQEEQAVWFDYGFSTYNPHPSQASKSPRYKAIDGRGGNHLIIRLSLPASVADELLPLIEANPTLARQIAEQAVLQLGGLDETNWTTGGVRPPYEHVSPDHRMYLIQPDVVNGQNALLARKLEKAP